MDGYGYGNGYSGGYEDSYSGSGGYGSGSYDQSSYGSGGGYSSGGGYGMSSGGYGGGGYGGGRGGSRGGGRGGSRGGGRGGSGGGRRGDADYYKNPESEPFRKLFIGGLSYETTDESLKEYFGTWGEIVDCVVMKDPQTKRSRGFGFITYKEACSVEAGQASRPHKIDGKEVESKRAMPRNPDGQSESSVSTFKLFVGGVKEMDSEEDIRACFGPLGDIEEINMITDKNTGKLKPFCFVKFTDTDTTDKCVLKHEFEINGHNVQVKKAEEKDQKQNRMGGGRGGGRRGGYGGGYGDFGGGYGEQGGYGGGAMRGGSYTQRGQGPYGQVRDSASEGDQETTKGYGRGGGSRY